MGLGDSERKKGGARDQTNAPEEGLPSIMLAGKLRAGFSSLQDTLRASNDNSNFFEVEIPVVFRRYFFLDRDLYLQNRPPKPHRETTEERAARFKQLMDENDWTRAELARQLGVSRAWVTKVLKNSRRLKLG